MGYIVIHESDISYMLPMLEAIISGYCFCRLVKPFLVSGITLNGLCATEGIDIYVAKRKRYAACIGVVYFFVMLTLYTIPVHMRVHTAYGICSLAMFSFICQIDRKNYRQKAFLVVVFFSLNRLSAAMAEILYDNLYDFAENIGCLRNNPNLSLVLYAGVCLFYLALEFGFTLLWIRQVLKVYRDKGADMENKELIMLVLPSIMGIMACKIIQDYRISYIVRGGGSWNAYDILIMLFYAASAIAIVVVIVLYQDIKVGREDELQNKLLAAQIDSIGRHIVKAEELYQDIQSVKHDIASHILTLERLYEGNKPEEAKAYSADLKAALCNVAGEVKSGNPVTDVILQELKKEAGKKGILFRSEFCFPTGSDINAFDVSVILNNALQNAMENVSESGTPYISVRSYHRNNAYMIEIKNSFTGNLQWGIDSGLPVTSKKDKDGHGYGLSNIRKVARKYSGDIAIDFNGREFCLTIMLIME